MYLNIEKTQHYVKPLPITIKAISVDHNPVSYASTGGRPNYQLIFCTRGTGKLVIGSENCILSEGYGYLIFPKTSYGYYQISDDWQFDCMEFSGPVCGVLMDSLGLTMNGFYYSDNQNLFHNYIEQIYEMSQQEIPVADTEFSTICYRLLLELPRHIHPVQRRETTGLQSSENDAVLQIINYLETNFSQSISLDDVAKYVGLNKRYMCTLFKEKMNNTIVTELTNIRMGQARTLLKQYPEKRVNEIAQMCGFESGSYFGKVFRKYVKCTPDQYRKTNE